MVNWTGNNVMASEDAINAPGLHVYARTRAQQGRHIGKLIGGRFLIQERIAEGAEGIVYRAHERHDPSALAVLKIGYTPVTEALCDDGLPMDPIRREHAILELLKGARFPVVFDAGRVAAGHSFVAREHYDGLTLARILARGHRLPEETVCWLGRELLTTVRELHAQDVVHRDVKPANILLTTLDEERLALRLIDYGAACRMSVEPPERGLVGIPAGTPAYMAPERARGEAGGAAADIFAVAAICHELLTGLPPLGERAFDHMAAREILAGPEPLPIRPIQPRDERYASLGEAIQGALSYCPWDRLDAFPFLRDVLEKHAVTPADDAQLMDHPAKIRGVPDTVPSEGRRPWYGGNDAGVEVRSDADGGESD
jgi:serine/threonine-protein kinase